MFKTLIQKLKDNPRTIVFTEGTDARILEASSRLLAGTFLKPILVGNEAEVRAAAEEAGYNINGAEIIDPKNYDRMDEMVAQMAELRKGKMTDQRYLFSTDLIVFTPYSWTFFPHEVIFVG